MTNFTQTSQQGQFIQKMQPTQTIPPSAQVHRVSTVRSNRTNRPSRPSRPNRQVQHKIFNNLKIFKLFFGLSLCRLPLGLAILVLVFSGASFAMGDQKRLEAIMVEGEASGDSVGPLPEIQGARINSGKKTTSVEIEALPEIATNNYRQAFTHTPGLLTSEVGNESFASFSVRGIGDPHETFNVLLLQDGLAISADPYGYPANYYTPTLDYVERLEFVRGGAALMYGPQAGGSLNFVTREPNHSRPWAVRTKQVFGSASLFQTYNEVSGTTGPWSYLAQFNQRSSEGHRVENSDSRVRGGAFKLSRELSAASKLGLNIDLYHGDHGEPGGLALTSASGVNGLDGDWAATSLANDRLRLDRSRIEVNYQRRPSPQTEWNARIFTGKYDRVSRRQAVGSVPAFGGVANGTTNTIAAQKFASLGAELRSAHDWSIGDRAQTFALGLSYLQIDSPYSEERGATPADDSGELRKKLDRQTRVASFFAENRFVLGGSLEGLKITPGLRVESIQQEIDEKVNVGASVPLRAQTAASSVPLLGLGLAYDLPRRLEAYGNLSQGYKPITFADSVPLASGDTISEDIKEGRALALETGVRGKPLDSVFVDVSVFRVSFTNQFGRVGSNMQNVGASSHEGIEGAFELGLFDLLDDQTGSDLVGRFGSLAVHFNASLLSATFDEGPLAGKTPQYAPRSLVRSGLTYSNASWGKVALLGTFVARHFADDANSSERVIPSYSVWDLMGEARIASWGAERSANLVYGIGNLFDRKYYSRVRSNGIEPAIPRNFYAGFNLSF